MRAKSGESGHGLGHKHLDFRHWRDEDDPRYGVMVEVGETVAIIDDFHARHADLPPDLRTHARAARGGNREAFVRLTPAVS